MPVIKLTPQQIPLLECPPNLGKIQYCDATLPGLLLELRQGNQNSTYYARFKSPDTKKTAYKRLGLVSEISLNDARRMTRACQAEVAAGSDPRGEVKAKAAMLTFSDFFENHYLAYVKPRKRSWASDESLYRNYLKDEFGSLRLDQIDRQQVQLMHTKLRTERKLAPATADHGLKLMRQAINLAISWEMCTVNPAAKVPLYGVDNKVEHYLDDDQLQRLLAVLHDPASPRSVCQIALFLLSTGARLNEALTARWDDVDVVNRVWRIPASVSKSGKVRAIPLNDSALAIVGQLDTQGRFDHLFVNHRISKKTGLQVGSGKPYTTIMKVWSRLRAKAGLPFLRIHDLRHMYASFLVNSGRTLYEVQACLGHSDPKVTQRYAHLSTKSLQDAANSASLMIRGAMPVAIPMELPLLVDLAISEPVKVAVAG